MLTEGWDAQNVTQILGLRAFTSQLLCEQVVGRGLRRLNYDDFSEPEYVDIYGVPFEVIPVKKKPLSRTDVQKVSTLVRALPERRHLEITFPRVEGYVFDVRQRVRASLESVLSAKGNCCPPVGAGCESPRRIWAVDILFVQGSEANPRGDPRGRCAIRKCHGVVGQLPCLSSGFTEHDDLDDRFLGAFSRCQDLLRQPPMQAEGRAPAAAPLGSGRRCRVHYHPEVLP